MILTQYYLDCLSHASYLIGDESSGRAVVVDPRRDVATYIADAEAAGLRIERVIETHFHADFLSGHLELASRTGSVISYGTEAHPEFAIDGLEDGQRLSLGEVTLEVRHTPGHTPESISVVVWEHAGDVEPYGVLTGDTLFIGDVGRPDLLTSAGMTSDELARMLYRSLREKLMTLPDATRVFPAHGAGSACGKNLSTETTSTIGEQRRVNYALAPMSEDAFVEAVTEGQGVAPAYFAFSAARNKQSHPLLDEAESPVPLTIEQAMERVGAGAVLLDTRDGADFAAGHLVGSVNAGLTGRFAEYAGDVIGADQPVVLVTDPGMELESRVRLARIGFDRVVGHVADPLVTMADHPELTRRASRLVAAALHGRLEHGDVQLVDVRNPGETHDGLLPGAITIPVPVLREHLGELDPARPTVVYCAGGYRSSLAASLLRANGFDDVSDLLGGYAAWVTAELPVSPAG